MASSTSSPMQWDNNNAYPNPYDFPLTNSYNGIDPTAPGGMGYGDVSSDSIATSRSRKLSDQGKKALKWLTGGKRSTSPNPTSHDYSSQPPSPSSFVVRTVTRNPGGVSQHSFMDTNDAYPYQKVRSQPIQQMSLGVPPGGPGGGTGYGTAMSSNDGRPERQHGAHSMMDPLQRSNSRGSQRSSRFDRSRSASPTRPSSPGAIRAGAFRNTARISPGPLSSRQQSERDEARSQKSFEQKRDETMQHRVSAQSLWKQYHPEQLQQQEEEEEPRRRGHAPARFEEATPGRPNLSRRPVSQEVVPCPPEKDHTFAPGNVNRFSMPIQVPQGERPPQVIPIDDVHFSTRAGISPLGPVSPVPSPGAVMAAQERGRRDSSASQSPATAATRWFKGIFGRSPRHDEREDYMYRDLPWASSAGDPYYRQQPPQPRASRLNDGSPVATRRMQDPAEAEAEAQKRQSMLVAAKIEDEHRNRLMSQDLKDEAQGHTLQRSQLAAAPTAQSISQQQQQQHLRQSEVVPPSSRQDGWDPPRSRSPPGRKPAPQVDERDLRTDGLSALEKQLTPAQLIIAETRSRIREREYKESAEQSATKALILEQRALSTSGAVPDRTEERSVSQQERRESVAKDGKGRSSANMKPGEGPMPSEMPLPEAMQHMMARFYRFERYVIPLVRSLEARVGDIERDNQKNHQQSRNEHEGDRDREIDRWVAQMTAMMRKELGQIQVATRDIREAREGLTRAAEKYRASDAAEEANASSGKNTVQPTTDTSTVGPSDATSKCSRSAEQKETHDEEVTAKEEQKFGAVEQVESSSVEKTEAKEEERKKSNFSSASFNSALPLDPNGNVQIDHAIANASPNGRPRYTHALGQPLQNGKLTPQPSPNQEKKQDYFSIPPLELEKTHEEIALAQNSPAASHSISASRQKTLSIDDRLRGLVSRSASASSSSPNAKAVSESFEAQRKEPKDTTKNSKADDASGRSSSAAQRDSLLPDRIAFPRVASPLSPDLGSSPPIPQTSGESIRTSSNASQNLRARAQNYLQQAENASVSVGGSSPGMSSRPFGGARSPLSSASPSALTNTSARRSLSGSSALRTSGILGARDMNAGAGAHRAFSGKSSNGARSFTQSAAAPANKSILDSVPRTTFSTNKAPSLSTPAPQRMSIRDRVAFFDSQMG